MAQTERGKKRQFLGTNEIAHMLNVTPTTIQRWIDSGALSCIRTLGGHRRVSRGDLIAFLSAHHLPVPMSLEKTPVRILLVDDDPQYSKSFKKKIMAAYPGVSVDTVDNGFQALILIGQTMPDVVFLDSVMPEVDGLDAIRQIKKDPRLRKIKIIAMSARGWEKEKRFRAAGADAFFSKDAEEAGIIKALPDHVPALRPAAKTRRSK